MRVLAASAAPSQRLNQQGALIYKNESPDKLAEYALSIAHYLSNQHNLGQAPTHFQNHENSWTALPPPRKEQSAFYKDAELIQRAFATPNPLIVRRQTTQSELAQALEVANALCLKEEKLSSKQEILPWFSPTKTPIPDDIKQKIKELQTKHADTIERFISRLSTLLDQKDVERLEEPGREFSVRLRAIRDEFTRAECMADLEGIKSAANDLDTLASDLSTLSTNLYASQTPDVQKTGANLIISSLILGVATSCLTAAATFLFLPDVIPAVTGLIVAVIYASFKFRHVQQETTDRDKKKEWDQARALLNHTQEETKNLNTQTQQMGKGVMNDLIRSHNQVISSINLLHQQVKQQAQKIEKLEAREAEKTGAKTVIESQQEATQSKTADPTEKAESALAMKQVV